MDKQPKTPNEWEPGEFVFWSHEHKHDRKHKLDAMLVGPYEVIKQTGNEVRVRHMHNQKESTLHVERLFLFMGSREDAERLAQRDTYEYDLVSVVAYRGNPSQRNNLAFKLLFSEGLWRTFAK